MPVSLRAQLPEDLPLLTGRDSEFVDFGPVAARAEPHPPGLDGNGGLTIVADDGQPAGDVGWHWTKQWGPSAASRCPMIGIWLRPEYRGRGIAAEAQTLIARLLFAHTATNRVEASTEVDNVAEQRALERAGFTREGCVRGACGATARTATPTCTRSSAPRRPPTERRG
jgi:RimJ/RimL family protein N-acetyltransferase